MKRFWRILGNVFIFIGSLFMAWMIVSYIDVMLGNAIEHTWNLFRVIAYGGFN